MTVFTHRRPDDTPPALELLAARAAEAGVTLRLDEEETRKHGLSSGPGCSWTRPTKDDVELCVVLGGDGTILRALQRYAGTGVPVFAINFGEIGFLATVEPQDIEDGRPPRAERRLRAAAPARRSCSIRPPGREPRPTRTPPPINDVAIHRKVGERVAELAYALDGEEAGSVRCDGLVVATPAGSTGYNLANGGPVMAWGVEGFVVSFIAPHSMSAARARGRPRRPAHDLQPLARAARRRRGRAARRRDPAGRPDSRRASSTTSARSPSCPAPPSTAACARSSGAWRAEGRGACCAARPRGPPAWRMGSARAWPGAQATCASWCSTVGASAAPVRCIEAMKSSSWAREKRRWPPGVR